MMEDTIMQQQQPSLFDAVANKDHEKIVELYAVQAKNSITSFLKVQSRWSSMTRADTKSEEKLDEYLQHLSYRESSSSMCPYGYSNSTDRQWDRPQRQSYVENDSSFHAMISGLNELLQEDESDEEVPFKRSRKQTRNSTKEADRVAWESAAGLSNSRPSSSFVVYPKDRQVNEHATDSDESGPALFDGSVANATPPPLISTGTSGGGAGTALHLACALDAPFCLALLLAMGADAGAPHTAFRRLMMHEAACCGSSHCLELLLNLGKRCSTEVGHLVTQKKANTPLYFPALLKTFMEQEEAKYKTAKREEQQEPVSFLSMLKHAMDLARQVKLGNMSEMDAARAILERAQLSDTVLLTLAKSCTFSLEKDAPFAQTSYADGHGNTPLHWAGFKNEAACVALLLQFQADPNARAHPSGWTPLHDAAYSDAAESVELLMQAGAHVDARANSGATPLCFAAQEDASRAAKILLRHGANLGARCCGQPRGGDGHQLGRDLPGLSQNIHHHHGRFSGYTPLHYCAHYNAFRAARVLLAHPSSVRAMEIPDLSERLPIHVAVARGSSDVLRELLHGGARVDTGPSDSTDLSPRPGVPAAAPLSPTRSSLFGGLALTSSPPRPPPNVVTPVSSPILRSMIPSRPVMSSKPWNCLSQRSIDECRDLISQAEQNWTPDRHSLFTPADRRAVMELLRVGKRLEQSGTGIFLDLWPLVLSFCGRAWFDVPADRARQQIEEGDDKKLRQPSFGSSGDSEAFSHFHLDR